MRSLHSLFMGCMLLMMMTVFFGCTKDFKSYNTDPTGITGADLVPDGNIGAFFPNIEAGILFTNGVGRAPYQVAQNLNADCYSGYMMSNDPFNPNVNNLNYFFTDRWNTNIFNYAYGTVMGGLNNLAKLGISNSQPDFWAIALILKVEDLHRVTDKYGPIPYSQVGKTVVSSPYDDQKSVYNRFFAELDTAVSNLKTFVNANPGKKPFQKFDLIYGGDYNEWIKLANSLRLRLAMHIVKVDPATAKLQGEKALSDAGGLLSVTSDLAQISGIGSYQNPLYGICINYADIRMGASAESILVGYNDPRLPKYFAPATDPAFAG
ncbi:MAG: SusD/RagB family nutrient-binding outer membrane lipoprotein, partial [Ginsengibacter sp.]